jgi:hypothetical protein
MADLVLESHEWDLTGVSRRFLSGAKASPCENQLLSGHQGEWFTVACAAYCALERMAQTQVGEPSLNSNLERIQTARSRIFEMIQDEIHRHSEIFGSLWAANDGIGCLKASAIIAHNLGDLDRVMDLWDLSAGDPLRLQFYKLGSQPLDGKKKLRYKGRLWISGQLYASRFSTTPRAELPTAMAFENHRHFALRKPKCLRTTPECLIPFGPFLDPWGTEVATQVANASGQPSEDTHEVIQALLHGWERLPHTVGYGRALRAMGEKHPELPIRDWAKSHPKAKILEIPQSEFESQCALSALEIMEEIPGRM